MPSNDINSDDKSLERLQEATKRGSEVLPATISGSTAEQPPVAIIPANPAVVPVDQGAPQGEGSSTSDS